MEPDNKRKFNFGTGEIDVDKWLLDIDAGREGYIKDRSDYWGQERTLEVNNALTDLIGRISSGDMTSRNANGTYNFNSLLYTSPRGKYTKWAYLTALGYLGNKGRGQITTTPGLKKVEETQKPKYTSQTLIQRLNNTIKRGATELDLGTTWWGSATPEARVNHLKQFFTDEAKYIRGLDGELGTTYSDLNKELLAGMMDNLVATLGTTGDPTKQFNQLGIDNILKATVKSLELPADLTIDQQILKYLLDEVNKQKAAYLELLKNKKEDAYYNYDPSFYKGAIDLMNKYHTARELYLSNLNSPLKPLPGVGIAPNGKEMNSDNYRQHLINSAEFTLNFLQNLGANWEKLFTGEPDAALPMGEGLYYTPLNLAAGLAALLYKIPNNEGVESKAYLDDKIDFPKVSDGVYYIPNSYRNGNVLLLDTNNNRLIRSSILNYSSLAESLGVIPSHKEGGVLKFYTGGAYDPNLFITPDKLPKELPEQPTLKNNSEVKFSDAEKARIGATIADIVSLGTAFVPGYGTAASAILGLGSTATNFVADLTDGLGWGAAKNAGMGLAADVMGLIPGLGGAGKGAKIAKNMMWAVPKILQWINTVNGLNNAGAIKDSVLKLTHPSDMTLDDWQNVSLALQIMTGHGRSVATKVKKAGMSKKVTTSDPEYYIYTNRGKEKVSDEIFRKLRETRGRKNRQAVTEELMGNGVTLNQAWYLPNTSTRFGAFREVPGKTKVEIENKHRGWFSDENLVLKAENFEPIDFRSILGKVNPYKGYYAKRNKVSTLLEAPTVEPKVTEAPAVETKPKRKPLTEELKQARALKRALKKLEAEAKLKQMREQLNMSSRTAMLEEIPQAGSLAIARELALTRQMLSSPYANMQEVPTPPPVNPRVENFNQRYGRAIGRRKEGGTLDIMRYLRGGTVKYLAGGKTGVKLKLNAGSWYDDIFSSYKGNILNKLQTSNNIESDVQWLNGMLANHSKIYLAANASGDWKATAYEAPEVENYQKEYLNGGGFTDTWYGFNDYGITSSWDRRYDITKNPNSGDNKFNFKADKLFSAITDDRRLLGRKEDWEGREALFKEFDDELRKLNYKMQLDSDGYYYIYPVDNASQNPTGDKEGDAEKTVSKENELNENIPGPELKKPFDPRALYIGARVGTTLFGNNWLYDRMLDRLPLPVFKDFIDRKLDTIGDYSLLARASGEAATLRDIANLRLTSDLSLNLAADFEAGRLGFQGMKDAYRMDDAKQALTHEAALQVDMKDLEDNRDTAWYNRRALWEYLNDRADIYAAKDKATVDAITGAVNNLTALGTSKYLEKKNAYNNAMAQIMSTPRLRALDRIKVNNPDLYNKVYNNEASSAELALFESLLALEQRKAQIEYALDYYALYGGGLRSAKAPRSLGYEPKSSRLARNGGTLQLIKDLRK